MSLKWSNQGCRRRRRLDLRAAHEREEPSGRARCRRQAVADRACLRQVVEHVQRVDHRRDAGPASGPEVLLALPAVEALLDRRLDAPVSGASDTGRCTRPRVRRPFTGSRAGAGESAGIGSTGADCSVGSALRQTRGSFTGSAGRPGGLWLESLTRRPGRRRCRRCCHRSRSAATRSAAATAPSPTPGLATVDAALDAGWTFFDTAEAYLESGRGSAASSRAGAIASSSRRRPSVGGLHLRAPARRRRGQPPPPAHRSPRPAAAARPEDWVRPFGPTPAAEIGGALERRPRREGAERRRLQPSRSDAPGAERGDVAVLDPEPVRLIDRGDDPDDLHLPVEQEIIPFARSHGIAFFAYSPLSRGLLADNLTAARTFPPTTSALPPALPAGVYEEYVGLAQRLAVWARERGGRSRRPPSRGR